jgi:hypothetical protein
MGLRSLWTFENALWRPTRLASAVERFLLVIMAYAATSALMDWIESWATGTGLVVAESVSSVFVIYLVLGTGRTLYGLLHLPSEPEPTGSTPEPDPEPLPEPDPTEPSPPPVRQTKRTGEKKVGDVVITREY